MPRTKLKKNPMQPRFLVSTDRSCVYLQNLATEFYSSKVNLPISKHTKTGVLRRILTLIYRKLSLEEKSVAKFLDNFPRKRTKKEKEVNRSRKSFLTCRVTVTKAMANQSVS